VKVKLTGRSAGVHLKLAPGALASTRLGLAVTVIGTQRLAGPDRQLILDAHRARCDLNENNRQLFRNVIELLDGGNGDSK
jgi:hypothetical protein